MITTLIQNLPHLTSGLKKLIHKASCARICAVLVSFLDILENFYMKQCLYVVAFVALAGCAAPNTAPKGENLMVAQAQYSEFPSLLFAATIVACDDPNETLVKATRTNLRCEILPPPRATAFAILNYDGTVDDLPRLIYDYKIVKNAQGYLLNVQSYLDVPQKDGRTKKVFFPNEKNYRELTGIIEKSGGRLIKATP